MLELLPDDILIIILKKLDFQSQANLYEVSECVKRIFMGYKVTKECNISLSTMATVKTLQTDFFKIIAFNLLKLDLSAVNDLNKTALMPIMGKMKHLETLDVSYTNINLKDFINIYKVCPTINKLTIDLKFTPKCPTRVPMDIMLECQKTFKKFESIHLFGNDSQLLTGMIPFMLQLSNLKILQYTITGDTTDYYYSNYGNSLLQCNHIYINVPSNDVMSFPISSIPIESYDYLFIEAGIEDWNAYGSPMFNDFFKENFYSKINNSLNDPGIYTKGDTCVMLWMKNTQKYDEVFFNTLRNKIRQFLVCFSLDSWHPNNISKYDKFCITPREKENSNTHTSVDFGFKRKRIVAQNHVLDYDEEFRDKNEVELNLMFSFYVLKAAITLNSNCEYLKKLTYLQLIGTVKYSATFFNILFRSCVKLVTLNAAIENLSASDVARSAPLSHSIKNLRIVAKVIDFNSVLTSLSQCSTLENVHIVDMSSATPSMLFDPTTMIQKCANLYCVHITDCGISASKLAKQIKIIENAKTKFQKTYLSFKVLKTVSYYHVQSRPYVDVFRLSQIKNIKLF